MTSITIFISIHSSTIEFIIHTIYIPHNLIFFVSLTVFNKIYISIKNQQNLLRIPYTDIEKIESILDTYLLKNNHVTIEYSTYNIYSNYRLL